MTKKLTKVAMTTALAASAIVPAVVATPAQAAEAEVTFAKAYYTTANGTAAFTAGELGGVIASTTNKEVTYLEGSNGEVFTMTDYSGYFAANPTATPNEVLTALSKLGKALSADQVKALNVKEGKVEGGKVTVDADAPVGDVKVESVKAINLTTVEVKFNTKVDAAKAENFSIEGGKVNGATLSEDGKTVTLSVSGLTYDKEYTLVTKDIKVNDEVVTLKDEKFKTPAVSALWKLEVSAKESQLVANGADNTVIEFKLLGADGKVDKDADNIVLEIGTTFGNLANTRVTVQDGVGQVVLSSEYSTTAITAQISAKIIEASEDYKPLIGKVAGQGAVYFVPSGAALDPNLVTFLDAESNQADRVVLYFDKNVDVATFVKVDPKTGDFLTVKRADGITKQLFKDNVVINVEQLGLTKEILGFKAVEGNKKAVEVILAKSKDAASGTPVSNTLTDNEKVTIKAKIGTTNNTKTFILTDARQPEVTGITPEGLKALNLKFSESIVGANLILDGQLEEGASKDFTVKYGEFDAVKAIDYRDTAKVTLGKYAAGRPGTISSGADANQGNQRYFAAGSHSVTVHQLKDFAGLTDSANVSSSQSLTFNVTADVTAPTAKVAVESPEQFRITFDKEIAETAQNIEDALNYSLSTSSPSGATAGKGFKIYNTTTGKYEDIAWSATEDVFKAEPKFVVTQPDTNKAEFVVELINLDWNDLLRGTNDTYANYKFQFTFGEKAFTNAANGVKSGKIDLDLNYSGSALNTVDNTSPVIEDIKATKDANVYNVFMNEPVKLPGQDNAGDTPNVQQGSTLPAVQVEFQGKDKDGKIVVIPGKVGYTDTSSATHTYSNINGDDKAFYVTTNYAVGGVNKNLEDLVKDGYSSDWKVVVKSISDDVGNTAATVTKDFKVEVKASDSLFYIMSNENVINGSAVQNKVIAYDNDTTADYVEITFSKAIVHTGGANDVTNPANWTLNGKALENVASIKVADGNGDPKDGNEKVIITFKDANALKSSSNVISVNKNLLSKDGTKLYGEYEVVAATITEANQAAAQPVIDQISGLPTVGTLTYADKADVDAARSAYTALTSAQRALVTNLNILTAAEAKITELGKVISAITPATATATATAATSLENAKTALGTTVTATLVDGTTEAIPVTWSANSVPTFNGSDVNDYVFTGTLTLQGQVTNPNSVTVTGTFKVTTP